MDNQELEYVDRIANPGSALGLAIGASMEQALQTLLEGIADQYGCYYITSGVRETKQGKKAKKLLMYDNFGNDYDIDGVIANAAMQPLILFESKYIRYKKHNRDKGSWLCTAHPAIRRRYHSIRSSIAILAGNWSRSSVAMMKSHDINIFLIPFHTIVQVLTPFGIDYNWGEKESAKIRAAWNRYNELTVEERNQIGFSIISAVENELIPLIAKILDDSVPREISKVSLELISSFGEVKIYEFGSVEEAIEFLQEEDLDMLFITLDSITLFDPPPMFD